MVMSVYILLALTASSVAENKRLVLENDMDLATVLGRLQQNMSEVENKVLQQESRIVELEAENQQLKVGNQHLNTSVTIYKVENQKLSTKVYQLSDRVEQLGTENQLLSTQVTKQSVRITQLETISQKHTRSEKGGSVYVRWGRSSCPGNGTDLIYKGRIGGTLYTSTGGGSNSLCLPEQPTWNKSIDGKDTWRSAIYGTEVEDYTNLSTTAFGYNYLNQDPPCATCHTHRGTVVMIPGRMDCYPGWTTEYSGYLVGGHPNHASTDYICLDSEPGKLPNGLDSHSGDQHVLYFVEAHCGSLLCPPYHEGREFACTVCSK